MSLFLGIMSGTSLDGIDLALADFTQQPRLIHKAEYSYPQEIKNKLLPLSQGKKISLEEIGMIDHLLGQCYAKAVNRFIEQFKLDKKQITAIGCHGQTVFHKPKPPHPFTMQLGDANLIAALTGITTVADFRRKDMAFGGQGAPLVPAFHQDIFATSSPRIILNIGGIANISVLIPNKEVIGYDTGPGNMLMDSWIEKKQNQNFDKNGNWAASGNINKILLTQFLTDDYFAKSAPKSTGREHFHLGWLENHLAQFNASHSTITNQDVQATLLALTVTSIADQVCQFPAGELLVCGGGVKNQWLMQSLTKALPAWQVKSTDSLNIDANSLEAMAFAWLAYRTINRKSGNLPNVTGASKACCLGAIYYPD